MGALVSNADVEQIVRQHPNRFRGICSVNIRQPMKAIAEVRACAKRDLSEQTNPDCPSVSARRAHRISAKGLVLGRRRGAAAGIDEMARNRPCRDRMCGCGRCHDTGFCPDLSE